MERIQVFVDGACKVKDRIGGWGVYIPHYSDKPIELFDGELDTTNNRMELVAAIEALRYLPKELPLLIYTDSNYVVMGITQWIKKWQKQRFHEVKNKDLWILLHSLSQGRDIEWKWVKGHAGIHGNEMADQLANRGVKIVKERWRL